MLLTSRNGRRRFARTCLRRDLNRECFLEEAVERCLRDPEAPIRCLTGGRSDLVILRRGEDGQHLWAVHKHDCRAAQPSASH